MRILHVNKYLYRHGGAEGYMLDVAALQSAAGHDVEFFGMQHPDNPPYRYQDHFPSFLSLSPRPERRVDQARAVGRMFWSESSRRGMAAVLDDFRPDIVHLHGIYHQLSTAILRPAAARGIPLVMTMHDYKLACPSYQFLAGGEVCTLCIDGKFRHAVRTRCKDGSLGMSTLLAAESRFHRTLGNWSPVGVLISPSRFLAEKMAAADVFPDRIRVVPNFTDPEVVEPKATPGGPVVYAGRLAHEKGLEVLIEAVGDVPESRLEIAGDGPLRTDLEALADRVAPGRVVFHGRLPRQELVRVVRAGTVSVVCSTWYENMPLAVLESFACGVPVIATDLGGLPEMVSPGIDGLVVPVRDRAALAKAIRDMVGRPEAALAMGRAGRVKVEQTYSPEVHMKQIEEAYRAAFGGRTQAAVAVAR